jgi:hypothetical protein
MEEEENCLVEPPPELVDADSTQLDCLWTEQDQGEWPFAYLKRLPWKDGETLDGATAELLDYK